MDKAAKDRAAATERAHAAAHKRKVQLKERQHEVQSFAPAKTDPKALEAEELHKIAQARKRKSKKEEKEEERQRQANDAKRLARLEEERQRQRDKEATKGDLSAFIERPGGRGVTKKPPPSSSSSASSSAEGGEV